MNFDRLGLLGTIALIVLTVGAWNFLMRTALERHRDAAWAQAASKFW